MCVHTYIKPVFSSAPSNRGKKQIRKASTILRFEFFIAVSRKIQDF